MLTHPHSKISFPLTLNFTLTTKLHCLKTKNLFLLTNQVSTQQWPRLWIIKIRQMCQFTSTWKTKKKEGLADWSCLIMTHHICFSSSEGAKRSWVCIYCSHQVWINREFFHHRLYPDFPLQYEGFHHHNRCPHYHHYVLPIGPSVGDDERLVSSGTVKVMTHGYC